MTSGVRFFVFTSVGVTASQ